MAITKNAHMALTAAVNAAYKHVPPHSYMFESDRWLELIVLLLIDAAGLSKEQAIAIASHLSVARATDHRNRKLKSSLKKNFLVTINAPDFEHARMEEMAASIERLSKEVERRFGGGIQSFLRSHGERMASELAEMLRQCGVPANKTRRVAILWLQNVANMPVLSVDDEHVSAFCRAHKVTKAELIKIADAMSLNVAYVDDALLLEHQRSKKGVARKAKRSPRKAA